MQQTSYELAKIIYTIVDNKKTEKVEVIDIQELTTVADIFMIITCSNVRQVKAMAEEIQDQLKEKESIELIQKEGHETGTWILLDYGSVIIHVLYKEDAEFYGIERLWSDGKSVTF